MVVHIKGSVTYQGMLNASLYLGDMRWHVSINAVVAKTPLLPVQLAPNALQAARYFRQ